MLCILVIFYFNIFWSLYLFLIKELIKSLNVSVHNN